MQQGQFHRLASLLVSCLVFVAVVATDSLREVDSHFWQQSYNENQKLLVLFYRSENCDTCATVADRLGELVGQPEIPEDLELVKSSDNALMAKLGVPAFPSIVYLRDKSHVMYEGTFETEDILRWVDLAAHKVTKRLNDESFEHLTQASSGATTGDWLVAFFQEKCKSILPVIESVGVLVQQRVNVAVVSVRDSPALEQRFAIKECPEIIFFKQGKMYRYELPKRDTSSLKSFVEGWHKNVKAAVIPVPKSGFDHLTESIAKTIKHQVEGENRTLTLVALGGVALTLVLTLVFCCRAVVKDNKQKKE